MKPDVYTEQLFCIALLQCGTDIAAKVLKQYIAVKDNEDTCKWLQSLNLRSIVEEKV